MNKETENMLDRLRQLLYAHAIGEAFLQYRSDAEALRRISMTLHRWHELECGTDGGAIERDEKTGKPYWISHHHYQSPEVTTSKRVRTPAPDRERGALKRLAAIMKRYPSLQAYVQTDPRGAALYILKPDDIPEGATVDSCYSRGVAVYK